MNEPSNNDVSVNAVENSVPSSQTNEGASNTSRLQVWLSYVPGTKLFYSRCESLEREETKKAVNIYMALDSINEETRKLTIFRVSSYLSETVSVDVWGNELIEALSRLYLFVGVFLSIILSMLYVSNRWMEVSDWGYYLFPVMFLIILILPFLLGAICLSIVGDIISKISAGSESGLRLLSSIISFVLVVYGIIVFRYVHYAINGNLGLIEISFVLALMSSIGIWFTVVSSYMFQLYIESYLKKWRRKNFPEAVVVSNLINILRDTDFFDEARNYFYSRREKVINLLEDTALCIEHEFPRVYRGIDIATDAWFTQHAESIAAAFRELKKWVLMPKSDTCVWFVTRISDELVHAILNEWDAMERCTPDIVTPPQVWHVRIVGILRTVITALLPLCILLAIAKPLKIAEPYFSYGKIGAYIWIVLSLLAAIDPSFSTKATALKDITGLLPGKENKDKK